MSGTITEAAPTERPARAPQLTFRPDIEGLRALAVGLVVVLHFGVTAVSGGYVGVDVFFVISGFLITSLLLDEVRMTERVSILGFYARRARRILPAACIVIAVTVVVAYLQLGALTGRTTAVDGQWAAGFAANFRFIHQGTDYFASSLPPSPLQHFWSLAVEEQFYLVWPTLLFGLVVLGRRFRNSALALHLGLAAIIAASLYWSIHLTSLHPTDAYFSPFTRAWELGAGAVIAVFSITIGRTPAALRAGATWVGLAMVAVAAFTFTATTRFPGYTALLPVVGTGLLVAGGIGQPAAAAGRLLSVKPLRWLGKISFSVYLWHWPVIVIAEERSTTPLSNVARIVCVLITLVLSVASFYLVEHPIRSTHLLRSANARNSWERSRKALALGATVIVLAVAVSVYTNHRAAFAIKQASHVDPADPSRKPTTLAAVAALPPAAQLQTLERQVHALVVAGLALRSVPARVNPPVADLTSALDPEFSRCLQKRADTSLKPCTFGNPSSPHVLVVIGDSHAMQWMPAIVTYGGRAGYRIVSLYKEGCATPSIDVFTGQPVGATTQNVTGAYPECSVWRSKAFAYVRATHAEAVITSFSRENTGLTQFDQKIWLAGLRSSLHALQETGAKVVEIGNNPYLKEDPGLCLSRSNADPGTCTATMQYPQTTQGERDVVRAAGATFIDIEPWFCSGGRCPSIIDDRIVYANYGHLSVQYVSDIEPVLALTLKAAGLR